MIRLAEHRDLAAVAGIYDAIHTAEERGEAVIGWVRGVYPTAATAQAALDRGDLYVLEDGGKIVGTAVINRTQVDVYSQGAWRHAAPADRVLVLHTLVIHPDAGRRGYGRTFVAFYEDLARRLGCPYLRMDTNERNLRARAMYRRLGYEERGIVPCVFNGIEGVGLVLLEKKL